MNKVTLGHVGVKRSIFGMIVDGSYFRFIEYHQGDLLPEFCVKTSRSTAFGLETGFMYPLVQGSDGVVPVTKGETLIIEVG